MSASDFTNSLNERMHNEANENNLFNESIRQQKKKDDDARDEAEKYKDYETDAMMGISGALEGNALRGLKNKYGSKLQEQYKKGKGLKDSLSSIAGDEMDLFKKSRVGRGLKLGSEILNKGYDGAKKFNGHKFTRDVINRTGFGKTPVNGGARQIIDTSKIRNIQDSRDATGDVSIGDEPKSQYDWNKVGVFDKRPMEGSQIIRTNVGEPQRLAPAMRATTTGRRNIPLDPVQDISGREENPVASNTVAPVEESYGTTQNPLAKETVEPVAGDVDIDRTTNIRAPRAPAIPETVNLPVSRRIIEGSERPGDFMGRMNPGKVRSIQGQSVFNLNEADPEDLNAIPQKLFAPNPSKFIQQPDISYTKTDQIRAASPLKGMPRSGQEEETMSHMNNPNVVQVRNPTTGNMRNYTAQSTGVTPGERATLVPKTKYNSKLGGIYQAPDPVSQPTAPTQTAQAGTGAPEASIRDAGTFEEEAPPPKFSWMNEGNVGLFSARPKPGAIPTKINTANIAVQDANNVESSASKATGVSGAVGADLDTAKNIGEKLDEKGSLIGKIASSTVGKAVGKALFVAPALDDLYKDISGGKISGKNTWDKIANVGTIAGTALDLIPGLDIVGGAIDLGSAIAGEVGDEEDKKASDDAVAKADATPAQTIETPAQGSVGSAGGFVTAKAPAQQVTAGVGSF